MKPVYLNSFHGLFDNKQVKPKSKRAKLIPWDMQSKAGVSCKIRNDYADMDYLETLDEKSLKFIKAFNREYYNADFKHKGRKLNKSKKAVKHVYDMNNQRNRCMYAKAKCSHRLETFFINPPDITESGYINEDAILEELEFHSQLY